MTDNVTTYSAQGIEFTIEKSRFGLYTSVDTEGNRMITGPSEEACVHVTKTIQIPVILGTFDGYTSVPRSSTVQGKL